MEQVIVRDLSATRLLRRAMVDNQIRTFDVTDQPVLDRFYTVPRELFLPPELASLAYSDAVLTVGEGGTRRVMLIPMVLARLIQGAAVQPTDKVLLVGGGLGYAAAILAGLAASVVSLESDPAFGLMAGGGLRSLGLANVTTVTGPLAEGSSTGAPYDVIVVAGAVESGLETLLGQLAMRGRLVTIRKTLFDGVRRNGKAVLFERLGPGEFSDRNLFDSSAPVIDGFQAAAGFSF
jgi:protein-L-isoaspartate(D-aspartate) O-methyltransferase